MYVLLKKCYYEDNREISQCFLQFRNQYDNDVTTWSPQGRIHQIEYAMEAVKQGSSTVGLKSKDFAVLVALKVFLLSPVDLQKIVYYITKLLSKIYLFHKSQSIKYFVLKIDLVSCH